jgi:hypothetical protein
MLFALNVLALLMDRDDRDARTHTPEQPSPPERRPDAGAASTELVSVRLIRKYADMIDGVNLAHRSVGDELELTRRDANILIAEGWAVADGERKGRTLPHRSLAADRSRSRDSRKPKTKR